jgi:hypothetical protein
MGSQGSTSVGSTKDSDSSRASTAWIAGTVPESTHCRGALCTPIPTSAALALDAIACSTSPGSTGATAYIAPWGPAS